MRPPTDWLPEDEDDQLHGSVCIHYQTAYMPNPPMSAARQQEEMVAAREFIQTQYDAGVPLFSKDRFRDLVRQIDDCMEKENQLHPQKISVIGLDGLVVWFPVETGKEADCNPRREKEFAYVSTKPVLLYRSIENLLSDTRNPNMFSVARAYLPVEIAHQIEVRNAKTGVPVDLWPIASTETVRARFEDERRHWEGSECFARLKGMFSGVVGGVEIPKGTNKVVGFACSTLTWPWEESDKEEEGRERDASMAQHALMLAMRDILERAAGDGGEKVEIKCFAQDPIYTPVDEHVLGEVGITVLDDPRGFIEVDESSVVISVSPNVPVKQIVADIARPAVIIWDKIEKCDYEKDPCTDPDSKRVVEMMKEYIELPFPHKAECFGSVAVYVRKKSARGG
ncbi:hypothetical protein VTI74DRAFT_7821 [Chaetomium olivicolor]